MSEPKVTEEVSYRTVTETKNSTTSNKRTIVSRTTNVNAVQVNCYDADGTLKSKDMDQNSWEERDTQNYEWSGHKQPPEVEVVLKEEEAKRRVFNGETRAIETNEEGKNVIILTSSNVCNTPSIQWTGVVNEADSVPGSDRSSATKLDGSKWVHSEESVSMTMGKSGFPATNSFNVKVSDINNALLNGKSLDKISGLVAVPSSEPATQKQPAVSPPALSTSERRQMRRSANREMIATAKNQTEK